MVCRQNRPLHKAMFGHNHHFHRNNIGVIQVCTMGWRRYVHITWAISCVLLQVMKIQTAMFDTPPPPCASTGKIRKTIVRRIPMLSHNLMMVVTPDITPWTICNHASMHESVWTPGSHAYP